MTDELDAIARTAAISRMEVPMDHLVKQEINPNVMTQRQFDLLVDNMQKVGWVDPLFVRPIEEKHADGGQMYRIVGGAHRYDAGEYLGFTQAPCTIVDHDDFEADEEAFQVLRMNVIKGKIDPTAFFDLYQTVSDRYADEVLQDAFGFAEEAEFKKLIERSAKTLPTPELRKKFKEAAAEIKTIDGLAKLLNEMFTKYGSTLPFGYMVLDYGGQRSIWLQVSKKTMEAVETLGLICVAAERTMDDVFGGLVQQLAKGEHAAIVDALIAATPPVEIPEGTTLPVKDLIVPAVPEEVVPVEEAVA